MKISYSKRIYIVILFFVQVLLIQATVPAGYYYYAKNRKRAALKTALHDYCKPLKEYAYGGGPGFTWEGFYYTDRNANNSVIDMYSDSVRYFNGYAAVSGMHIEHSFPKSWWGGYNNGAYKDLFHLYPSDGVTNSTKNNLPLGEVSSATFYNGKSKIGKNGFGTSYTGNCFEPADEYKGDFARSYLYISTIHEELAPLMQSPMTYTTTFPFWQPWAIELLRKWSAQDPVSEKERTRNETIYKLQGNRNPFIDYPELINYIWGSDSTKVYPFPEETEPFLVTPRPGDNIDMGVILVNDSRSIKLHIQGVNINAALKIGLQKNTAALQLSETILQPATVLAGKDISLTFSPTSGGTSRDTILIVGGGKTDTLRIPVKALASTEFAVLEPSEVTAVGGTLNWMSDPLATNYRLNIYQGDLQAGDLIISGYAEGSSWNKAIELYNGTTKAIDLSKYSLQKQSNGMGSFSSTLKLTGTLASGQTYTIVHKQAGSELLAKASLLTDSLLQFNGNDAIILLRGGLLIDMVGQADAGADIIWGENVTLKRKTTVTHPRTAFRLSDWLSYSNDDFSAIGNHSMGLATEKKYILRDYMTGITNTYTLSGLAPDNIYTYSVEAMRSGVIAPAVNTMQINTASLDAPVIMEPEDIGINQFKASWEETLYATGYLLNLYNVKGQADTTATQPFDGVGTNGTPLPTGWTGTASGNYTSTSSAGVTPPSIALKNNGEWLQTVKFPHPVSKFTYMYKFPSTGTGSSLGVYGLSNGTWIRLDSILYLNTSKYYPSYNFSRAQGMSAFKFIYHKSSGNISIDDVAATYGNSDTTYIYKDEIITSNSATIQNLTPNTLYFYSVRATLGNAISAPSEIMDITTASPTAVVNPGNPDLSIANSPTGISIRGLQRNETICIYNLSGVCINSIKNKAETTHIPLTQKGVYIVTIRNNDYQFSAKLIH